MDRNSFKHEPYLVEQLKKGHKEAYGHLFLLYHKELCNYLTAISGDSKASEEIAQQAFIKIWENRSKLQVGKGKLKRYVFKIAYNVFIDTQRRKKKELQLLESLRQQAYLEIAEVDSSLFEERLKRVEKK